MRLHEFRQSWTILLFTSQMTVSTFSSEKSSKSWQTKFSGEKPPSIFSTYAEYF